MSVVLHPELNIVVIPQEERRQAWLNYKPVLPEIKKPHAWTTPIKTQAPKPVEVPEPVVVKEKSKSDHGNIGKVWMLNRQTSHRVRIEADQVSKYEWMGYVRGGPRSK